MSNLTLDDEPLNLVSLAEGLKTFSLLVVLLLFDGKQILNVRVEKALFANLVLFLGFLFIY